MVQPKPHLLICATPVYGHIMPLRAIAQQLIKLNYEVTFLTGSDYESVISSISATFVPLKGEADITEDKLKVMMREIINAKQPPPLDVIMREAFIERIPAQWEGVQRALKSIQERKGDQEKIVVLIEGAFRGALPGMLGASYPGHRVDGWIGVGIVPMTLTSVDVGTYFQPTYF